jgi:hypothetical protein
MCGEYIEFFDELMNTRLLIYDDFAIFLLDINFILRLTSDGGKLFRFVVVVKNGCFFTIYSELYIIDIRSKWSKYIQFMCSNYDFF